MPELELEELHPAEQQLDRHRDRQPGLEGHAERPRLRAFPAIADRRPDPAGARHRRRATTSRRKTCSATPTSRRSASRTRVRCSRGSLRAGLPGRPGRSGRIAARVDVAPGSRKFAVTGCRTSTWFQKKLAQLRATPGRSPGELDEQHPHRCAAVPDEIPPRPHRRHAGCARRRAAQSL